MPWELAKLKVAAYLRPHNKRLVVLDTAHVTSFMIAAQSGLLLASVVR